LTGPLRKTNRWEWSRLRERILARDKRRCRYCNVRATEIDHVVPIRDGGTDHPNNLVASCWSCTPGGNVRVKLALLEAGGGGPVQMEAIRRGLRPQISPPASEVPHRTSREW
jgi:hypothetical protein